MSAEVKVDQTRFNATFREYLKHTSRSLTQAVNDKLFMVARQSLWRTHKAERQSIRKHLKVDVRSTKRPESTGPRAAMIINKRLGPGNGFKGSGRHAQMAAAMEKMMAARERSVAYTKSGWLPSIQTLAKVSSIKTTTARGDAAAKQIGKPKGRAVAAKDFVPKPTGFIENTAWAKKDKNNAFYKYGGAGLQAGFDAEVAEMEKYIARKMQPAADKFNAAQR